ncbi:agmatine deiminase family protein [Legionella sp. W05-934-2]|jgi:agmatine/peptidylarginine deiminase|uniref:agmatine deiminase family protein n=1 Tax=Legionella sp. W05-934-2 TaxID=1198649 RepID=UPI003461CAA7
MKSKSILKKVILVLSVLYGISAYADSTNLKHDLTREQKKQIAAYNRKQALSNKIPPHQPNIHVRPFSDYEKPGYLIMTSNFSFNSKDAKLEIAKALGEDAILVLITESSSKNEIDKLYKIYSDVVPKDRMRIIKLNNANNGFWARDAFPIPLVDESGQLGLLSSLYYKDIKPGLEFTHHFSDNVISNYFYFEGGNLQTNHLGVCMIVNNDSHRIIPDSVFSKKFGCKKLIRLPHLKGIGHIDEHARFINESTIITDLDEYADTLKQEGFNITKLPRPDNYYETYINSIQLDNQIVVPIFGGKSDKKAISIYRNLGFVVTTANSSSLSNEGEGSLHCITMVYPPVPYYQLLESINAVDVGNQEH